MRQVVNRPARLLLQFMLLVALANGTSLRLWAASGTTTHGIGSSGGTDWILLVDTSLSMVGKARGSHDIFPEVRESIQQLLDNLADSVDTFYVYSFDSTTKFIGMFPLAGLGDRQAIRTRLSASFIPNGQRTYIADAIVAGFARARAARRPKSDPGRKQKVILFTDGLEDTGDDIYARKLASLSDLKPYSFELLPHAFVVVWLGQPERLTLFKKELSDVRDRTHP